MSVIWVYGYTKIHAKFNPKNGQKLPLFRPFHWLRQYVLLKPVGGIFPYFRGFELEKSCLTHPFSHQPKFHLTYPNFQLPTHSTYQMPTNLTIYQLSHSLFTHQTH